MMWYFLIAILACHTVAIINPSKSSSLNMPCNTPPCLPNAALLQAGYDITTGLNTGNALGLGWGNEFFQNPNDGIYYEIPNGTTVNAMSVSTDNEGYTLFSTVDQTCSWQAYEVTNSYRHGMYAYSSTTNTSISSIYAQVRNTAYVMKKIKVYYVSIPPSRMVLSDECQANVDLLPLEYNYNMYRQFIIAYGTHVRNYSVWGGEYLFLSNIKTCAVNQESSSYTETQVRTDSWMQSDHHTEYTGYTSTDSYYSQRTLTSVTFTGGDMACQTAAQWMCWEQSLAAMLDPVMVSFTVTPLYDFIPDEDKRENMKRAYEEYLQEAYDLQNSLIAQATMGPRTVTYAIVNDIAISGGYETVYTVPPTTINLAAGQNSPLFGKDGSCNHLNKGVYQSDINPYTGTWYYHTLYYPGLAYCRRFADGVTRAQNYFDPNAWIGNTRSNSDVCTEVTVNYTSADFENTARIYDWDKGSSTSTGQERDEYSNTFDGGGYYSEKYNVGYYYKDPEYGWGEYSAVTGLAGNNVTTGYSIGWNFDGYIICYLDCNYFTVQFNGWLGIVPTITCTC